MHFIAVNCLCYQTSFNNSHMFLKKKKKKLSYNTLLAHHFSQTYFSVIILKRLLISFSEFQSNLWWWDLFRKPVKWSDRKPNLEEVWVCHSLCSINWTRSIILYLYTLKPINNLFWLLRESHVLAVLYSVYLYNILVIN